jgi:S-adenosylmethionine decarboxylase
MHFFEGPEKKVELVVKGHKLRQLGPQFWHQVVESCGARILSTISNKHLDAYLLSESSLFVWDDYFLMITCGQTILVEAVLNFVDKIGYENISSLVFQRKNEYFGHLQKSHFHDDAKRLSQAFGGKAHALQLGNLDLHHNFLFHLDRSFNPPAEDRTTELLMYHLASKATNYLSKSGLQAKETRDFLQLESLLPGWLIDDHAFSPVGYSVNAIKDDRYLTIHITPQEDSSYVSCETNLDTENEWRHLLDHFLKILAPGSFDLITFNHESMPNWEPNRYLCLYQAREQLRCGYSVQFSQHVELKDKAKVEHNAIYLSLS